MSGPTCDTSLLIPALASWHPRHREAWKLASQIESVPGHVLLETYSVLTRLPAPQRFSAADAGALIAASKLKALVLPPDAHAELVARAAELTIPGGAIYDALIATTTKHHGLTLISLDQRARPTYDSIGVKYTLL